MLSKKKLLFLAIILLSSVILLTWILSKNVKNMEVPPSPIPTTESSPQSDIIEFEGVMDGFVSDCAFDALCIANVKGYNIIVGAGLRPAPEEVGQSDVGADDVGKTVKVRARKDGEYYTIYGSNDLYVLKK